MLYITFPSFRRAATEWRLQHRTWHRSILIQIRFISNFFTFCNWTGYSVLHNKKSLCRCIWHRLKHPPLKKRQSIHVRMACLDYTGWTDILGTRQTLTKWQGQWRRMNHTTRTDTCVLQTFCDFKTRRSRDRSGDKLDSTKSDGSYNGTYKINVIPSDLRVRNLAS
jgi:hypothetical protein